MTILIDTWKVRDQTGSNDHCGALKTILDAMIESGNVKLSREAEHLAEILSWIKGFQDARGYLTMDIVEMRHNEVYSRVMELARFHMDDRDFAELHGAL